MSRLNKQLIYKMLCEASCIETPILTRYFKSVRVGEVMKQRIEKAKQKSEKLIRYSRKGGTKN
jgi:hypothetical protein